MNKDEIAGLVERLGSTLAGLETPMMQGDNLAITLCSAFDNPEQEVDEDTGWSPDAEAGYKEVCSAIHAHYAPTIEALADALTTLSARVETLEAALRRCFKGETQAIIPFTNPLLSSEVRR